MTPLVSVITPTWQRDRLLTSRCIPSVQAQTCARVEHIVVSDGPDPELRELLAGTGVVFDELPLHDEAARWGHYARLRGIELARGDYLAYLDDDNAFRPQHIERLVAALEDTPAAGFAYSQILMHQTDGGQYIVGADPPYCGGIDTSCFMHRRSALDAATWRCNGWQQTVDWDLIARWMDAGIGWVHVAEVTADYWFA